jgi:CRISPR-associated protein Cmr3
VERVDGERFEFSLHGVRARLAAAAVPRAQVVSGWDLAARKPKPSVRVAPAGSVYWLDELEATPEALRRLVDEGLWSEQELDPQRRAEGFNRVWLAEWAQEL